MTAREIALIIRKTTMATTQHNLSMKLLIDNKTNKVLFAEAGKDVIDFLFGLLAMPVGTIVKLLTKESMVGCVGNLYKSVETLDQTYMMGSYETTKSSLLDPAGATSKNPLFLTGAASSTTMDDPKKHVIPLAATAANATSGGFVKGVVTYSVMDDLRITAMSTISSITMLNTLHVKDVGSLEERNVNIGMEEGLKLLKASLQSQTVLTDVFISKKVG